LDAAPSPGETRDSIAFSGWQVGKVQSNVLDLDSPPGKIVIDIYARIQKPIRKGTYLIGLKDVNNTIVWSNIYHHVALDPGPATFVHEFARLPLNPGIYLWEVHVHDGNEWLPFSLVPEMSIVSKNDSAVYERWRGFLALESNFSVEQEGPPC
jgi:hypothetical protein